MYLSCCYSNIQLRAEGAERVHDTEKGKQIITGSREAAE